LSWKASRIRDSDAARRYSLAEVIAVERQTVGGFPVKISTSYVERQNLTLRMTQKRFARLTTASQRNLTTMLPPSRSRVAYFGQYRSLHERGRPARRPLSLGRRSQSWGANPLLKLEGGLAYPRSFEESFALRSGRCRLCAAAGFVCQLGKSNGQRNGLFFSGWHGVAPRKGGSTSGSQSPIDALIGR